MKHAHGMDRNHAAILTAEAQKWQERWKGVSNQLFAVLTEHHEGQVELSVPVFEKICLTPLATVPEVMGDKIRLTLLAKNGKPAIEKNPNRFRLDADQQDHFVRALAGVVGWLQRTGMSWGLERQEQFFRENPEWEVAINAVSSLEAEQSQRSLAPTAATSPEPEQPPTERCSGCGWAYGLHRPGCELEGQAAPEGEKQNVNATAN